MPSLAQRFEQATVVLRGTVTDSNLAFWLYRGDLPPMLTIRGILGSASSRFFGYAETRFPGYYALMQVETYYKGTGMAEIAVEGFGIGGDCMNSAYPGDEFILFASGDMPFLQAFYLNYPYSAVAEADARTLNELALLAGESVSLPDARRTFLWLPATGVSAGMILLMLRLCGWLALRKT
jgi:hypothetical protein